MNQLSPFDRALRRITRRVVRSRALDGVMGVPPYNDRGDQLDPQLHRMLWLEARFVPSLKPDPDPNAARRSMVRSSQLAGSKPDARVTAWTGQLGALRMRTYRPAHVGDGALVYLHGGGWTVGDLDSHDSVCRQLALRTRRHVLSVDYPLAPEHPFPTAIEALFEHWPTLHERAVALGAQPDRVALGGDSAGGNLSIALSVLLRDAKQQAPERLVLIYPGVDLKQRCESRQTLAHGGYLLTDESINYYTTCYAGDVEDPRASPIETPDLSGLPPMVLTTAGFDPLRDEGEWFVRRVQEETDGHITHLSYPALIHGYANMDGLIEAADDALQDLADWLNRPL